MIFRVYDNLPEGKYGHKFLTWMIWVPPWEGHPSILVNLCKSWRWRWCWHWRWPQDCRCVICSRSSAAASFNAKPDVLCSCPWGCPEVSFSTSLWHIGTLRARPQSQRPWSSRSWITRLLGCKATEKKLVLSVTGAFGNEACQWLCCSRLRSWCFQIYWALQIQIARPAASGFIALSIVPHQRRSSAGVIQARGSVFKGGKESISHNLCVVLRVPCGC